MPQAKANSISRHLYSSFKSVSFIVLPIITFLLAACDFNESPTITNKDQSSPKVFIAGGVQLEVDEGEVATIFGYDDCPEQSNNWLFGPSTHQQNCALITDKKSVNVRLILSDGSVIKESWLIAETYAGLAKRYEVKRPNGWLLREPRN